MRWIRSIVGQLQMRVIHAKGAVPSGEQKVSLSPWSPFNTAKIMNISTTKVKKKKEETCKTLLFLDRTLIDA
jgi:hypothetical protein